MSEIRYIPPIPVPTPGTTINPTNLFVPYRSNATTFLDSCLRQTNANQLQTIFGLSNNGINLQGSTNQYQFGLITSGTNCFLLVNGTSRIINLQDVGNTNGINVNFPSNLYQFGRLQGANCYLNIDGSGRIVTLKESGVDNGISVNFSGSIYQFGKITATTCYLNIDGANRIASLKDNANDNGFIFDFANAQYQIGSITPANNCYLQFRQFTRSMTLFNASAVDGLNISFTNNQWQFGKITGTNNYLDISLNSAVFRYNNQVMGFSFAWTTKLYRLGQLTGGTFTQLKVDDTAQQIDTEHNGVRKGMILNYSSRLYTFGEITTNNRNNLQIDDTNNTIFTTRGGSKTGIRIETNVVGIGSLTLGNQMTLGTDDAASSFIFNGTGITSATSGGNAGHLKVLINGTPYKIAFQNP